MTVLTTFRDQLAVIELNRPQAMNALNEQMLADLNAALDRIEASDCRGMVFTGAGDKAFCAGADITQLQARSPAQHRANVRLAQSTFDRIEQSPCPAWRSCTASPSAAGWSWPLPAPSGSPRPRPGWAYPNSSWA